MIVHAQCKLLHIPAWKSSCLSQNEMPYPLISQMHPTKVNQIIRPILSTAVSDRIKQIDWNAKDMYYDDAIVLMSLCCELIANKNILLLTNKELLQLQTIQCPLPAMYRKPDGVLQHGIIKKNRFINFFIAVAKRSDRICASMALAVFFYGLRGNVPFV